MSLLSPTSIAVIGASSEEKKVGHEIFKNLLTQGYEGDVYPVNAKHPEILGRRAYASIRDIPGPIDCAVIVTPAKTVATILDDCGAKGMKTVVVISAGFAELGTAEGRAMEDELAAKAKEYGMALVGPNCLGILRPGIGMNASFAEELPASGSVALLSQSGALAVAVMDAAPSFHLGFSTVISMGNKATMDECDFLELCAEDPQTTVIGLYLESITDGRRFLEVASNVAENKRIVLIKSGVTEHGRQSVSSHTGALAGSDAAIDAACTQCGMHRARTMREFLNLLRVLSTQPPLPTPNIAVITNAGGPGILATDAAEQAGLQLPSLDHKNDQALKVKLPPAASTHNPIDVLGDALADRYGAAMEAAADDPGIDGIAALLTPQIMTPCEDIARAAAATKKTRPLLPIVASFMGDKNVRKAIAILQEHGIPNFASPEEAIDALATLRPCSRMTTQTNSVDIKRQRSAQALLNGTSGLLGEEAMEKLLALYVLPIPAQTLVRKREEIPRAIEVLGFPLIAKISAPEILHKTDVGGVRVNIRTMEDAISAFEHIVNTVRKNRPDAAIRGVLFQRFLPAGDEFIVGALRDPSFGHLLMTGLGGIYTELFRDTAFRIAPAETQDAYAMLQELKAWKLLLGMRGKEQADIDALVDVIVRTGMLVTECPQIRELDFNPVIVDANGVTIADAKVIVDKNDE
ncbi:acetate--CoA ligase family protein [Candidatus Peregrinibacteria bacterium]|nr:acetate--CoA ligase family protein [Candidatus Peregrinibacteria bacterium]MBI3816779.1 acetate--CoA ligase family protein [Candidatus Peregrinibacteria bacterium]